MITSKEIPQHNEEYEKYSLKKMLKCMILSGYNIYEVARKLNLTPTCVRSAAKKLDLWDTLVKNSYIG